MERNYQTILTSACLLALSSTLIAEQANAASFGDGSGEIAISFPGLVNLTNNAIDFTNTNTSPDPALDNTGDLVGGAHTGTVVDPSPEYLTFGNITVENAGTTGIFAGEFGSSVDLRNKNGIIRDLLFVDIAPLVSGRTYRGADIAQEGLNWIKYDLNGNNTYGDAGDLTYSFDTITVTSNPTLVGEGFTVEYSLQGIFELVGTDHSIPSTFSLFDTANSNPFDPLALDPATSAADFNSREVDNLDTQPDELIRLTFDGKQGAESDEQPVITVPEPFTLVGAIFAFGGGLMLKKQRKLS